MKKITWKIVIPVMAILLLIIATAVVIQRNGDQSMISVFGKYRGYSQAVYDGTLRTSEYLTLSDGTRLAYDLLIPTRKGVPVSTTSYVFQSGSSIRITVAFADAGNFGTPILTPAPALEVLREANHASFVELPIVGQP